MILEAFDDLNWLAVVSAGVAYFVLGAVWYSNLLFGKQYRAALGAGEEAATPPVPALIVNLVGWIVAAIAMGLVSASVGADSFADGAVLGLVVWIGFVVTVGLVNDFYQGMNVELAKVNGPYNLLGFVLMGVILAVV